MRRLKATFEPTDEYMSVCTEILKYVLFSYSTGKIVFFAYAHFKCFS